MKHEIEVIYAANDDGWINAVLRINDHESIHWCVGLVHSDETAAEQNERNGLQVAQHPNVDWPGAVAAGDLETDCDRSGSDWQAAAEALGLVDEDGDFDDDAVAAVLDPAVQADRLVQAAIAGATCAKLAYE